MGDVVVANENALVNYWEVHTSKSTSASGFLFAGPVPRQRNLSSTSNKIYDPTGVLGDGVLLIDRGYPFMEAGNVTSWVAYTETNGNQQIGQMMLVIWYLDGGLFKVRGTIPMSRNMPSAGVWEHTAAAPVAVQKYDQVGLFLSSVLLPGSNLCTVPYDDLHPSKTTVGTLSQSINVVAANLTPGTSFGDISDWQQHTRRIGVQARGVLGATTKVTSSSLGGWYSSGAGGRMVFDSTTNFNVNANVVGTLATILSGLQDDGTVTNVFSVAASSTGSLWYRVAAQGSLTPIEKIKLAVNAANIPAYLSIEFAYSEDQTQADNNLVATYQAVTGWKTFLIVSAASIDFENPETYSGVYYHLGRKVRYLRMSVVNSNVAQQQSVCSALHIFGMNTQIGVSGQYPASISGSIRDRMWIDNETATMRITTPITAATTTTVAVADATTAELTALAVGDCVYLRQASTNGEHFRYVINSVNIGGKTLDVYPAGTSPGTQIAQTYAVNDFVDPPARFYQIRAFTASGVEIGRSGNLGTHGQFREKIITYATGVHEG